MKELNWLTCKPWLFTIKVFILFLIFLFLFYFMEEGLFILLFLYISLRYAGKLYTPKESV
jgi:hypothetical protein